MRKAVFNKGSNYFICHNHVYLVFFNAGVDVAFILDGSGSVGDDNYHGAFKDFIEVTTLC